VKNSTARCRSPSRSSIRRDQRHGAAGRLLLRELGLILAADEEAELAGVMAHETAHVCAHHAAREMTRMNWTQIAWCR